MTGHRRPVALLALAAVALSGCAAAATQASTPLPTAVPLANAVQTADGVWATVPLGNLSDPTNTFWQLLYRPNSSGQWVNDVGDTGTATNGGIDLAPAGRRLLAGLQSTQNLTFSPIIETRNGGGTWDNGLLPSALTPGQQSVAASPGNGAVVAVLGPSGPDQRIVTTGAGAAADARSPGSGGSDIVQWNTLTDSAALDRAVPSCRIESIQAVAYSGTVPTVGATCQQPGVAGILTLGPGATAALTGPNLGASAGVVEVLALSPSPNTYQALLEIQAPAGPALEVATADPGLQHWTESAPLALPTGETERALVAVPDHGFLVLGDQPGRGLSLESETQPGGGWEALPTPPANTWTVAPLPGGGLTAITGLSGTMTMWNLDTAAPARWVKGQVVQVPILFGTSN